MARTATTADVFNAIAEQHRRDILDLLVDREVAVGELVEELRLEQPAVSKHLKVLRAVDLVRCRTDGRRRLYRLNGPALEPVQHWLERYTAAVNEHYDRLDDYLATLQRSAAVEQSTNTSQPPTTSTTRTPPTRKKETRP
jgi:DNA-binding transcriptional ArsR family regulator